MRSSTQVHPPPPSLSTIIRRLVSNVVDFALPLYDCTIPPINRMNTSDPSTLHASPSLGTQHGHIAIVGMAAHFPGAKDANGIWDVLINGESTVAEIPSTRFDIHSDSDPLSVPTRSMKTKWGNFIDDMDAFDHAFFHISPREARSMDPQQRLVLRTSAEALENAGYVPNSTETFNPENIGVYVGVATNDYVQNLRNDIDVYYNTGTLSTFLSGRVSYFFKFGGPSMVVDTACSSSGVAIYQACRALNNGDCHSAVAGGVNAITSPDMYIGLDRAHFLSPTGQCRPWDASADGYCRSEGCGMFVLKRLDDALRENDNILGVIRGVEVNHSGTAQSITHPHCETQAKLFERVLKRAGVTKDNISVVEAHGTGTQAGDPTELESIRSVLAKDRLQGNPLHVTSIKANIGHAEAASGAASLVKLLLMLRHRTIPRMIGLERLNPSIPPLDSEVDGAVRIQTGRSVPWESFPGQTRMALLNNFGASGSNLALIVEEPPIRSVSGQLSGATSVTAFEPILVAFSAETESALEELRRRHIRYLQERRDDPTFDLVDFAYTVTARRQLRGYRIAVCGRTVDEICLNLERTAITRVGAKGRIAFFFSGQGGQYSGMGQEFYRTSPTFRRVVDECHAKLVAWGFPGVLDAIVPTSQENFGLSVLEKTQAFQSAIFVLEYAIATMWSSWGLEPDVVAGHSLGEYAALAISGVLDLQDALFLVATRARLMIERCGYRTHGLIAVKMNASRIMHLLQKDGRYQDLTVAGYNSPEDCILAGPTPQLLSLASYLKGSIGCKCLHLDVSFAYHSDAMKPLSDELFEVSRKVKMAPPRIPILSNVHGVVVQPGDSTKFSSDYFTRHSCEPVLFEQSVQHLLSLDAFKDLSVCLDIGPHPTTLPMLRAFGLPFSRLLPSLAKKIPAWKTTWDTLSYFYTLSLPLNWRKVFFDYSTSGRCIDAPLHAFTDTRFWVPYSEESRPKPQPSRRAETTASPAAFESSSTAERSGSGTFEISLEQVAVLIEGHTVLGHALCPASLYQELAQSAIRLSLHRAGQNASETVFELADVTYPHPLVYHSQKAQTIRVEVSLHDSLGHNGKFSLYSYIGSGPHRKREGPHSTGAFVRRSVIDLLSESGSGSKIAQRRQSIVAGVGERLPETYHGRTIYDLIFPRVVSYSHQYQVMKSITISLDGAEAFAIVCFPEDHHCTTGAAHSIFMDALLHAAGFVINRTASNDEAFICSEVGSSISDPQLLDTSRTYGIICNIKSSINDSALADVCAFELHGAQRIIARMQGLRFRKLKKSVLNILLTSVHGAPSEEPVLPRLNTQSDYDTVTSVPAKAKNQPSAARYSEQIYDIISDTCGLQRNEIRADSILSDIGVDSLMAIEITGKMNRIFPNVGTKLIPASSTITAGQWVSQIRKAQVPSASQPRPGTEATSDEQGSFSLSRNVSTLRARDLLSSILDIPSRVMRDGDDLSDLGLDSLTSIELLQACTAATKSQLHLSDLQNCRTVLDLETALAAISSETKPPLLCARKQGGYETVDESSVALSDDHGHCIMGEPFTPPKNFSRYQVCYDGIRPPLFLVHDGSGLSQQYSHLSELGCTVWGISNPAFFTPEGSHTEISDLAREYAESIRHLVDTSGCIMGGWSSGGVVAFEIARQLVASGVHVVGVVLIDSPSPDTSVPLPDELIDAVVQAEDQSSEIGQLIKSHLRLSTQALVAYDPSSSSASHVRSPQIILLRSREIFPTARYSCRSIPFLDDRREQDETLLRWQQVIGASIPMLDIPGNHFEPFKAQHANEVSIRLKEAIAMLN